MAGYLVDEENFMVYRRFGLLHAGILWRILERNLESSDRLDEGPAQERNGEGVTWCNHESSADDPPTVLKTGRL